MINSSHRGAVHETESIAHGLGVQIQYHIVWVPQRRRKVIDGSLRRETVEILKR